MNIRLLALVWLAALTVALPAFAEKPKHFDAKGKPPSEYTIRGQQALRKTLPLDDERDFAESKKGFVAAPESRQIKNAKGEVVWDIGAFDFLLEDGEFDSIHPSLQRQARLNMNFGLYKLSDDIYQVRGFDLANLTVIKGYQSKEADLTLTLDRSALDQIFLGQTKLPELIEAGKAKAEGDVDVIERLMSYQIDFDPRFQMVPGAGKAAQVSQKSNPFEP